MLETDSSSSEDSDDNDFDTLKLMESKNPFVRLLAYGKIKKMIATFKENNLKKPNQKLIRGLFKRKIKEFDEDRKQREAGMTLLDKLMANGGVPDEEGP